MPEMRINRALAQSGVASRRKAEEYILAGRIRVNGEVVTKLATMVDPKRDKLDLDGKRISVPQETYFIYYKPRGEISTMTDERGRECTGLVCTRLPGKPRPVGRLDRASEGLMLLTNNGALANRLMHPRYAIQKEYQATIEPRIAEADAQRLVSGVELAPLPGERIAPGRFEGMELQAEDGPRQGKAGRSRLLVCVTEGRNRFVRRMFAALGYETLRLMRVRLGPLRLGSLRPGETRALRSEEVDQLLRLAGLIEKTTRQDSRPRK